MSFFSRLFQHNKNESVAIDDADLVLFAPVNGTILPLKEVPDPVICEKIAGDGVAFIPESSSIVAPCDGTISRMLSSKNAFAVRAENGLEIYIKFGVGTENMNGEGFEAVKQLGDIVKKGDVILNIDLTKIASSIQSTVTSMIVIKSTGDIKKVNAASGKASSGETACVWVVLGKEEAE